MIKKILLFVDKDDYIREEYKDVKDLKEIWFDGFYPPNSKYLEEVFKKIGYKRIKFGHLQIITEDNYISALEEVPSIIEKAEGFDKVILCFSWFSDIPPLYKIENLLYKALEHSHKVYTLGIPLCYLVGFFDRSIEYRLIKKYGYKGSIERLPWKYQKSEQCKACFKRNLCFGVPYFYAKKYYENRKIARWEGIIDLYPLFE